MNLKEKAADRPDVELAQESAPGAYRLSTLELVAADDVSEPGEFPAFGDFLEVERFDSGASLLVECPAGLARWLVNDLDVSIGDAFRIRSVRKVDGEWQYDCEPIDEDGDAISLAEAAGDD